MSNPRWAKRTLRKSFQQRFRAMDAECGICHGALGPIHYDEPMDAAHPLSLVIDEIRPISKWKQFGYPSPQAAAEDWHNVQPAHRCCNQAKGAKVNYDPVQTVSVAKRQLNRSDGDW